MFEVAFDGRVGSAPRLHRSSAGKGYKSMRVAVRMGEVTEWVKVAAFNNVAKELPADLNKGERVYVEGKATLWRTATNTTLSVRARKIVVMDRIGRRRRRSRRNRIDGELSETESAPVGEELADNNIPL
jgi:single-stranded DNA-binding protein